MTNERPDTSSDELDKLREARANLNRAVKLLKNAGISQRAIAGGAGYSDGYVTQLLSDKYAIDKVTPAAVGRLVKSVHSRARGARAGLGVDDARELDRLLIALSTGFVQTTAAVYGMSGEPLDEREAVQFQRSPVDTSLLEHLSDHASYTVVQVSGAPGQGKTWALANLARDAAVTHEIVRFDFGLHVEAADLEREPYLQVGRNLRVAQQRALRTIMQALDLPGLDIEAPAPRQTVEAIAEHLGGVSPERVEPALSSLRRRLVPDRIRNGVTRLGSSAYADAIEPRTDGDKFDESYGVDFLAEDLCLLWALSDIAALVESAADSPVREQRRKLLVLVDDPDLYGDAGPLVAMLRGIAALTQHYPECRAVMVVVALLVGSPPDASKSSTVRAWYALEPFTRDDVRAMVKELRSHGWFRSAPFAEEDQRERLISAAERLAALNRRATCLYLDHCHRMELILEPEAYLDDSIDGDRRVPRWIDSWANHAARTVGFMPEPLATHIREWIATDAAARPIPGTPLDAFLTAYGLVPEAVGKGPHPLIQHRVRARAAEVLASGEADLVKSS